VCVCVCIYIYKARWDGNAHKVVGNLKAKGKMTPRKRVIHQNWPFLQLVSPPHYMKRKVHYRIKDSVLILSRNECEYIIKVDFTRMRYEGLKRIKRQDKMSDCNCIYHTLQCSGTFSCFFASWISFHHCLGSDTRPSFPTLNLQHWALRAQPRYLSVTGDVQLLFWSSGCTQPSCDWQQLQ